MDGKYKQRKKFTIDIYLLIALERLQKKKNKKHLSEIVEEILLKDDEVKKEIEHIKNI